jgi:hypothetical protein
MFNWIFNHANVYCIASYPSQLKSPTDFGKLVALFNFNHKFTERYLPFHANSAERKTGGKQQEKKIDSTAVTNRNGGILST